MPQLLQGILAEATYSLPLLFTAIYYYGHMLLLLYATAVFLHAPPTNLTTTLQHNNAH
jgi:hypothetical protein